MDACDALLECGFTKPLLKLTLDDVSQLINSATLHSTLLRIKSELDQFLDGLNQAGVLHSIQQYPDLFHPLFVCSGSPISAGI